MATNVTMEQMVERTKTLVERKGATTQEEKVSLAKRAMASMTHTKERDLPMVLVLLVASLV